MGNNGLSFDVNHPDAFFFKDGVNIPIKYAVQGIAAGATDTNIVTAVTDKSIRVVQFILATTAAGAGDVTFRSKPSGAGANISVGLYLAGSAIFIAPPNKYGYFKTAVGAALTGSNGGANSIGVVIGYIEVT